MSRTDQRGWQLPFALLYGVLAVFFAGYATNYLRRFPIGIASKISLYICLMLHLLLALAPGYPPLRVTLRERLRGFQGGAYCVFLFLLPYLIYCAGTGDFRWLAFGKLCGLAGLPFGVFAGVPIRRPESLNWLDGAVLLWLLVPVVFGQIGGIWSVPENLDFMVRLFLLGVGAWSFLVLRGLDGSGYEFRWSAAIARDSLVSFAGFTAIAFPLGLWLGFIVWNPRFRSIGDFLSDYATIFLFIAILEELFFRGILQNLLEGALRSRYLAQGVAAVIFGLSHIRHAPFPNWHYVLLATVAGWLYGSAFRGHRSLMASSALHALVDTIWRTWLTVPHR